MLYFNTILAYLYGILSQNAITIYHEYILHWLNQQWNEIYSCILCLAHAYCRGNCRYNFEVISCIYRTWCIQTLQCSLCFFTYSFSSGKGKKIRIYRLWCLYIVFFLCRRFPRIAGVNNTCLLFYFMICYHFTCLSC